MKKSKVAWAMTMPTKSIWEAIACAALAMGLVAAGSPAVNAGNKEAQPMGSGSAIHPSGSVDSTPSKVAYFSSEKVKAAELADSPKPVGKVPNSKTGNLYPWTEGDQTLAVRISRQESGEEAQTHEFRHVIYVLSGSATFVTDGTMVDPKLFEPITPWRSAEMRAPDIKGGTTYHMSKGDLITVPKEVPHWWKEVPDSPLIYLAINFVGAHGRDSIPEPGVVTYFNREQMAAKFASANARPGRDDGSVIFDGTDVGKQYQVYAGCRGRNASDAEVHAVDSEVIYVEDGSASLVTGGALVRARKIAADEIRGTQIAGGDTREVSKGDLIIVPHGTPLWYKEVRSPLSFLLVKIR